MPAAGVRAFLAALLLVVTSSGPLATAQQASRTARIGFLSATTPAALASGVEAFKEGLRELGYVEGNHFILEVRYSEGKAERLQELARELVRLKMDVIVTPADQSIAAARRETQTIPIVMALRSPRAAADQVRAGDQPEDGEGPRPHDTASPTPARRRGDPVGSALFAGRGQAAKVFQRTMPVPERQAMAGM
jgi:ABC-type uncharacterized transport system substrate-binding protein